MQTCQDSHTGLAYTLLTKGTYPCRKFYFSMESWTTDDQWILYHEDRPGASALHKVHQETGEDVLLAENAPFFGSARRRDIGYWCADDRLIELDIRTGEQRAVAELPRGLRAQGHYTTSLSGLVVNTYKEADGINAVVVTNPKTGQSDVCYRTDTPLGHGQFCPGDDDTLFFVHETGGDALQRMWMLTLSQRIARPFFVEQEGDWITHETWDAQGEEVSFIRWPHALMAGMKNGQSFRTIARGEYHHAAPNAAKTHYAADRTSQGTILLLDAASGAERVLLTNQKALVGEDHCHPSFNRAGTKIAFSAPGGGICQVGMLDLAQVL